ncbi:phage tail protein [Bradyrhizobium sp.]|uniref:phage tail protein n=1 Tax=Bradyrhizobium sp. TaxID=376 RepID=UPI003C731BF8
MNTGVPDAANSISANTNTAAATINPSGFGNVQVVRDGATGPGPLTGRELVATNAVSLIYDVAAGTFHILSPVNWPNTSGVPVGTIIPVAGFTAPTNYAFAYGQAVSRVATGSGTMTFFACGNGDGSTAFNLPDYSGLLPAGMAH